MEHKPINLRHFSFIGKQESERKVYILKHTNLEIITKVTSCEYDFIRSPELCAKFKKIVKIK